MELTPIGVAEMERTLARARTIAVLGIKPESRAHLDAHQIPLYLQKVGYTIVPVPTRYAEASRILGVAVRRRVAEIEAPLDVLSVFVKLGEFGRHLAEVVALRPGVVWFQSGLLDVDATRALAGAGIAFAEDCIGCRRASMSPSVLPLAGQAPGSSSR